MATLPPQLIQVEKKPQRLSSFETIVEDVAEQYFSGGAAAMEVAPAPVIAVKKHSFRSSLDTIWEPRHRVEVEV